MNIARNLILSATLVSAGVAHSANVSDNTPQPTFPSDVSLVYGFVPPNAVSVMNQKRIKAQQEVFETQRKAYEKAIAEQQKLHAEAFATQQELIAKQTQRMLAHYEAAMKAQHSAQNQAIQASQEIAAKQMEQMRKYYEAAIQAQQKAAENHQNHIPDFVAFPTSQSNVFVPPFENIEAQRKAITEHLEQLRLYYENAMNAHSKQREEQRKLVFDRLTAINPSAR